MDLQTITIPLIEGNKENLTGYGIFIGEEIQHQSNIPFYKGSITEGKTFNFIYKDKMSFRTARISPSTERQQVDWLERHMEMTQVLLGIGEEPFILALGMPTHDYTENSHLPDISNVKAFKLAPGTGVMLHLGTWHDFAVAWENPVTILTMASMEVFEALFAQKTPTEMNHQDIYKIHVPTTMKLRLLIGGLPLVK